MRAWTLLVIAVGCGPEPVLSEPVPDVDRFASCERPRVRGEMCSGALVCMALCDCGDIGPVASGECQAGFCQPVAPICEAGCASFGGEYAGRACAWEDTGI